jgi:hypothetical protein
MMAGKVDIEATMIHLIPLPAGGVVISLMHQVIKAKYKRYVLDSLYFSRLAWLYFEKQLLPYENNARKRTIKIMTVTGLVLTMSN